MANDLQLRLGGEMARKMGIQMPDDASPAETLPTGIESEMGTAKIPKALPRTRKQSAKLAASPQRKEDLWEGLPDAATTTVCKVLVSVRLDTEILDFFKESGSGYQTRINAVLLHYVRTCRARS